MTEADKIQKLTKNFSSLDEKGKNYTAAMVEALAQLSSAAARPNYADAEWNLRPPE